jgi:hypothetical protein
MKTTYNSVNSSNPLKITTLVFSVVMLLSVSIVPAKASMQDLKDTNLPLDLPLVMGYADGNKVFYITTEASHEEVAKHLTDLLGSRVVYTPTLKNTPKTALANIYEFTNGVEGTGPAGFQPNVADSQPGDPEYSPLWSIQHVTWTDKSTTQELTSEDEILAARDAGKLTIEETGVIVNCPFVQWKDGNLQIRDNKELTDSTQYGGGQLLEIDTDNMIATFVAHRGFAPDGSTIYYIATDASSQDTANALGVIFVNKTQNTLVSSAASDLYVFTNGIKGTGPMGFQASIGSTNTGDKFYSPLWRIQAATWNDAENAQFLTKTSEITAAAGNGDLTTAVAGFIVNCPFVEVNAAMVKDHMMQDKMMDNKMMDNKMMDKKMTGHEMSPKMQMDDGIQAKDVKCNTGFQLIMKSSDQSPVCVKPNTASILLQRGWAISVS